MSGHPAPQLKLSWISDGAGASIPYPDFIDQAAVDRLAQELVVRSTDVFVASYPKSGTTWLQQICHLIERGGVQGSESIVDSVPWIEAHALPEKPSLAQLEARRGRRFMQIHAPWSLAPGAPGRYIYVARNPRDVAVSFFHHQRAKQSDPAYTGDFAHFVDAFTRGQVPFGAWIDHVLGWWELSRRSEDVLFLRYEDMLSDLGAQLERVAAHIDRPLPEAIRAAIVEQSSFAHMKRHGIGEPKGEFRSRAGESAHLRKGEVGDWRNHFDGAQLAALDEACAARLAASGLSFDYG